MKKQNQTTMGEQSTRQAQTENQITTEYEQRINNIRLSLENEIKKVEFKNRKIIKIDKVNFANLIKLTGKLALKKAGDNNDFIILEHLKHLIREFYSYTIGEKYDINSAFAITGNAGAGKTVAITAFLELLNRIGAIGGYRRISARTFHQEEDVTKYEKGVLHIEEFGKNPTVVKKYGTEEYPIVNLLMKRYESREITFVDANLNRKNLEDIYSTLLADRFNQMFNFIEVTSEASLRRKK